MHIPVFLSVVVVVKNQSSDITSILTEISNVVSPLVSDYEIILVDNASTDNPHATFKTITRETGLPNLQIFCLNKEVDHDTAFVVGLEHALGDYIAVINPMSDDIRFVPTMLTKAVEGSDVVFAKNELKTRDTMLYRFCFWMFNILYKRFTGIHLSKEAPEYRLLSKRVVNFILQHPMPAVTYRHLPATGGFSKSVLSYSAQPKHRRTKHLMESFDRGMKLLISTTHNPMRIITTLCLFGAVSNLVYSGYVIAIALIKKNVAPGWVTLSLQQSGMFFLISLVLLMLCEYIIHMISLSSNAPLYYIAQEFTSAVIRRKQKLNIEESTLLKQV